jgi:hypothetical protein
MMIDARWFSRSKWMFIVVIALSPFWLLAPQSALVQPVQAADDCSIIPCGPSGMFTRDVLPTIAGIDFAAFPKNPAWPYVAKGRAWYVRPTGDDQAPGTADKPLATINRAVDLAQTGDVIQVADGTYRVDANQGSGIVLDKPGITLFAEHIGGVTLLPASDDVQHGIEVRADDLIVDGFIVQDFKRGDGILYGRLDRPQRNLVLKNLLIDGGGNGISTVFPDNGEQNPQPLAKGVLLYHVTIRNTDVIGFDCGQGPCQDVRLENLVIQMPGGSGNSGADAVGIESGDNILVFNADLAGAAADGLDSKATRVAAFNVVVHDVGRNGIKFWRGGDVVNALVYNTDADAAVVFAYGGTYRLLHVTVARHDYSAPGGAYAMTAAYDHPDDPGQVTIQNSIFYQNSAAVWISGGLKLDARNNIFFGSGNGVELVWARSSGEISVGESEAEMPIKALETAGGGGGNIGFVDPLFTNVENADYTLRAGSPAIDQGAANLDAYPDFDLKGQPRVAGKAPDLGPVER